MKYFYRFVGFVFLSACIAIPAHSFMIGEFKYNMCFLGGNKYAYAGHEIPAGSFNGDLGLDLHFVYPVKKYSPDHIGIGVGAYSTTFWVSGYGGSVLTSDHYWLSLYSFWWKFPLTFTYSYIDNCAFFNIEAGVYYAVQNTGSRDIEIDAAGINENIDGFPPNFIGPNYGLHFEFVMGFGIPDDGMFLAAKYPYPAIFGFDFGVVIEISLNDHFNSPAEEFNYWSLGIMFGIPFFLLI
ncbi:MAG: hypothetical protein HPY53_16855 [Brevinematales bacterium]|nr:hypothetical protein [Brevinematales bacterium]